ncbi:unnamed protein product [Sphagnum jensenii]|uniref:fructose-bisphosphate aldolase n=1 Tax=Sphagnum jensenii TaxID=128206 RepID=A0ABP1AWG5_9BRYO
MSTYSGKYAEELMATAKYLATPALRNVQQLQSEYWLHAKALNDQHVLLERSLVKRKKENVDAAQKALHVQAKANCKATLGKYYRTGNQEATATRKESLHVKDYNY